MSKIVHLELKEPQNGEIHHYFGSVAAIYDMFNSSEMGIVYDALCNALRKNKTYENRHCIVRVRQIIRKSKSNNEGEN